MTVARGRRRRALFTAIASRLGDLERYGLLALVAALLLGVACLAQALGGSPSPIRAMTFQGVGGAEPAVIAAATAPSQTPEPPIIQEAPQAAPAAPVESAVPAPDGVMVGVPDAAQPATPAAASRAGFDFFEPPVRLPGKPAVLAPAPPVAGAADSGATTRRVKIQRGDTLQKIAARELGGAQHWRKLVEWNPGLDPKKLPAGGHLNLQTERRAAPPATTRAAPRQHEVARNDTLQSIAQRYLGDRARWIDLLEANRDQLRDPTSLRAGMKIRIP